MGFRIRQDPDHGAPVSGPPKGWKRPAIPQRVILEVLIAQNGRDPVTQARLEPMTRGVDIDHDPALKLRAFDPVANDTVPAANDPRYLVIRDRPGHAEKTNGRASTSHGSDKHAIAKIKRITGETKGKAKKPWPKRKFPTKAKSASRS